MDFFFQELHPHELFWPESLLQIDAPPSLTFHKQTAFDPFTPPDYNPILMETSNFPSNTRNTMLPPPLPLPPPVREMELNNDRSYQHMMTERLRRKTMRQSYMGLHSLLPRGSKTNKNSIVQMATLQLQKLQGEKEALRRKNKELESAAAWKDQNMENSTINLRVANPSSPIDSMIEVMKCLKAQQLKLKNIRTEFSSQELQAKLQIESTIATAAVEKSVECTLKEVERKFWLDLKEGS